MSEVIPAAQKEINENRVEEIKSKIASEEKSYLKYLDLKSIFYNYSLHNSLLVYLQNRDAIYLATQEEYEGKNLKLKEGATPIRITVTKEQEYFLRDGYMTRVEEATFIEKRELEKGTLAKDKKTHYIDSEVYDVSQLDIDKESGERLTKGFNRIPDVAAAVSVMTELALISDIDVLRQPLRDTIGYYDNDSNQIILNIKATDNDAVATLCKTYSQALLYKTTTQHPAVAEFEAASVSYTLARRFGVEPHSSDLAIISNFVRSSKETEKYNVEDSLERINKIIKYVNEKIDSLLLEYERQYIVAPSVEKEVSARQGMVNAFFERSALPEEAILPAKGKSRIGRNRDK